MAVRQRKHEKKSGINVASKPKNQAKSKSCQIFLIVTAFFGSFTTAILWQYYLESHAYTPFPAPPAVHVNNDEQEVSAKLWGTYRSHLYFGLRTRTPESLLIGLSWFSLYPKDGQLHIRYTCEQSDNLRRYGWLLHDGKNFGMQEIVDEDFALTTEYLKQGGGSHGGDWTARITGRSMVQKKYQALSIMIVVSNEGRGDDIQYVIKDNRLVGIQGKTPTLGEFKIKFKHVSGNVTVNSYLASHEDDIYDAQSVIRSKLKVLSKSGNLIGLPGLVKDQHGRKPNFLVHQVVYELPFVMDVVFESASNEDRQQVLTGDHFSTLFNDKIVNFDERFERIFQLQAKGYNSSQIYFAKAAMSNMIGGIGYFHGNSKIKTSATKEPIDYWKTALYTGVPSRSFFPRGFLWDEGFHQLLIQKWDPAITRDVLAHWLDLLNYNGWIPREQILGTEARRKVPDEFVVQHNEYANPPTFFISIQSLIEHEKKTQGDISTETVNFLKHVFPRLVGWFTWYNTTQKGRLPGSYRWRGRDDKIRHELNPKTLTSGLDDYPRASHPSVEERHVDLRCWIALSAGILADIAEMIGINSDNKFRETELYLRDNTLLDKLHWSEDLKMYADYGNHTKFTALEMVRANPNPHAPMELLRVVRSKQGPTLKYVNEFGYISLFPFLLRILQPDSPKLKIILNDIRNPNKLWTSYGLRSLAKTAPMYKKHNTQHDKPYWRGPIWININYLAVRALNHYAITEGPNQELAGNIYKELRDNIVNNLFKQYTVTGYIWEQYNDVNGRGQGCYPFTGWSGLVTLLMGELF